MIRQKLLCLALLLSSSVVGAFMPHGAGGQPSVRQAAPAPQAPTTSSNDETPTNNGRLFPPPKMGPPGGFYGEQRKR